MSDSASSGRCRGTGHSISHTLICRQRCISSGVGSYGTETGSSSDFSLSLHAVRHTESAIRRVEAIGRKQAVNRSLASVSDTEAGKSSLSLSLFDNSTEPMLSINCLTCRGTEESILEVSGLRRLTAPLKFIWWSHFFFNWDGIKIFAFFFLKVITST